MRAMIYTQYGPPQVLHLAEVETPTPKDNEVLVKVGAASVKYGDVLARNFKNTPLGEFNMPLAFWFPARLFFGFNKPRVTILGAEFAGEIEAVGKEVKRFKPGDRVFGYRGMNMGAYAEYLCMPENDCLAPMPTNTTFEEAAVLPYGAIMALSILRKANIGSGQKVLISGAGGGIGAAAVQLAGHHFGAEVTGVCGTRKLETVKNLGAQAVIDYSQEDFTQRGETYDLILDILGKIPFSRSKKALTPKGTHFFVSFKTKQLLQMLWTKILGGKRVKCATAEEKAEDLEFIKELVEAGKIKSFLDKSFPLEEAAEAHQYYEQKRQKGHIALTVAP